MKTKKCDCHVEISNPFKPLGGKSRMVFCRLHEAAPEMLKACKHAFALLSEQDDYGINGDIAELLQKVIAKAEGRG